MDIPMTLVCNWNITHDEDKNIPPVKWPNNIAEVNGSRIFKISHGICKECQSVVREEIKARAKERR